MAQTIFDGHVSYDVPVRKKKCFLLYVQWFGTVGKQQAIHLPILTYFQQTSPPAFPKIAN